MYPDEQAATLAAGKAITKKHTTKDGWTIKTKRAPILSVAKRSLAADSQVAWKRELGLGRATNQELPEALYGRNLLALRHEASGVRLAFDARKRRFFKMGRVDGVSRRWRKRDDGVPVG
ncbi:unnamed protein product [Pelagomonas calceolata]|uniref:Uncharacterized protein n=1 Tax=Pelagomonas calceolata TaxID=35677 RepID=A0A8J2WSG0_9STRA|nr:unnamed protein product [Pelagomonas calceolata]